MYDQIFRETIPNQILFDLLDKVCIKTDNYYLFDMNAYRKLAYHEYIQPFCQDIRHYYYLGKQFYVTRKQTYKSFTNLLRQICKRNVVMYAKQIVYNRSEYNIHYLIYYKSLSANI
mgnify:FL=1|jgi:hypothetical protein